MPVALGHVDDGDHRRGEFVDVADVGEVALGRTAECFRRDAVEQDEPEIGVFPPRGRAGVELLPAEMKVVSGSSPVISQLATMCGCLPPSGRPSSECEASSKNNSESDCAARALTAISGPLTTMRSEWGIHAIRTGPSA